ncbi:MAG: cytochrome c oxidase, subunit [Acidimicrobiales bacterium]|nr:cytochrome c oxidase, subunit [Acidimicrobiales bacterium]
MTAVAPVAVPIAPAVHRGRSVTWWGMLMVIATEGTIFLCLLASWYFLWAASKEWPPAGVELPDLKLALPFSFVLWGSSIPVVIAEHALRTNRIGTFRVGMAVAFVMGAAFLVSTAIDFNALHYGWRDHAYGSAFYTIVGLHAIHVLVGLVMNAVVQVKAALGRYDRGHHRSAEAAALYWHFVDGVWVFVFPSLFLAVHFQ